MCYPSAVDSDKENLVVLSYAVESRPGHVGPAVRLSGERQSAEDI